MSLIVDEKALWYLTRSTGLVSLLLLTGAVVLGMVATVPSTSTVWSRFVTQLMHRNVAILAVVFVAAHAAVSVAEAFVTIRPLDVLVPFVGSYRPLEIGLGALAVDLLLAVVVTSALRQRLGHRAWRSVHWAAYAAWPIALVHGVRLGSDMTSPVVRWLVVGCIAAVVLAAAIRVVGTQSRPLQVPAR